MSNSQIKLDIPYYSQWESPELVDRIVWGEMLAREDPLWETSGASSPKEYEFWAVNICGMACLKMILAHMTGIVYPTVTLARQALVYRAYTINDAEISDLFYVPLCKYVKEKFAIEAHTKRHLTIQDILTQLEKRNYVIASVNSSIREENLNFEPAHKGGHLVLLTGYDQSRETLTYHDPSGYFGRTQIHRMIDAKDFERFFAERGIVVQKAKLLRTSPSS